MSYARLSPFASRLAPLDSPSNSKTNEYHIAIFILLLISPIWLPLAVLEFHRQVKLDIALLKQASLSREPAESEIQ